MRAIRLSAASVAATPASDATPLVVSVSLPPQVWLVESIGGERVTASALVGPGDSEETYAPTDAQVSAALGSAIFFRIGASFEEAPWFRALAGSGLTIVDARDGVAMLPLADGAAHGHGGLAGLAQTVQQRVAQPVLVAQQHPDPRLGGKVAPGAGAAGHELPQRKLEPIRRRAALGLARRR